MHLTRLAAVGALAILGLNACSGDLTDPDPIRPSFSVSNTPTGDPQGAAVLPTPSTNAQNYANGWAHVLLVAAGVGQVELNFVSLREFWSCFEYRVDDAPPASATNPNPAVTDGLWAYTCRNNNQGSLVINAQSHVDVRMVFGAETDERFDWTRFYVLSGQLLTLHDELDSPLAGQAGDSRYRCGGSWTPWVAFTSDGSGQFAVDPNCDAFPGKNWDSKVTVRINQVSREQIVTSNPIYTTAKVNVNLTSCTGPITASPGGTVAQGGGYWFTHGTTGPSGTVSFYTFPGNVKLRMAYNHLSVTKDVVAISAGANEVNFPTTEVTLIHSGNIRSNTGGSWWNFAKPSMDLQPGSYNFYFHNGTNWGTAVPFVVSGCETTAAMLRVIDEDGNGVAGAKATPAIGGSWQPQVPGSTNAEGYLFGSLPSGYTKVKMEVNQGSQEKSSAQMVTDGYTWTTQILRIGLNDHAGTPITTGATLEQGGGYWYTWGSLGTYRDIQLFPGSYKFKVTYNFTSQDISGISVPVGFGPTLFNFQTGQAVGACITQYSTGTWRTFTDGMELMPGTYPFRYPAQSGAITAGGITNLTC
ncbi:MAG: hypothetical protein ABR551_08450 [Gemmatimonadales bacterium]